MTDMMLQTFQRTVCRSLSEPRGRGRDRVILLSADGEALRYLQATDAKLCEGDSFPLFPPFLSQQLRDGLSSQGDSGHRHLPRLQGGGVQRLHAAVRVKHPGK